MKRNDNLISLDVTGLPPGWLMTQTECAAPLRTFGEPIMEQSTDEPSTEDATGTEPPRSHSRRRAGRDSLDA